VPTGGDRAAASTVITIEVAVGDVELDAAIERASAAESDHQAADLGARRALRSTIVAGTTSSSARATNRRRARRRRHGQRRAAERARAYAEQPRGTQDS